MNRKLYCLVAVLCVALIQTTAAHAGLDFCNKTLKTVTVAVGSPKGKKDWVANGWWDFKPGECGTVISGDLKSRYYYFYAYREDGSIWSGDGEKDGSTFCTTSTIMNDLKDTCAPGDSGAKKFSLIDTGEFKEYEFSLTSKDEKLPKIKNGVIHEQCLFSWDDSIQPHSVGFDGVKMKKLRHCIRLRAVGPIEVEGIAKRYIKTCVNEALNDQKTLYLVKAISALGVDVLSAGSTGGGATAAAVTDYVYNVQDKAISCLTDTGRIKAYMQDAVSEQFDAVVEKESHWEYWKV